ncbi:MAG TPA: hypothetical protein VHS58_07500 [Acetobacteraceae bacterium]|jgi:hypothetical protein|nr:hypothetical protein [Acetobacteraceae bacterium]
MGRTIVDTSRRFTPYRCRRLPVPGDRGQRALARELINLIGLYCLVSITLSVSDVPVPEPEWR